jgi:hypothetical protein
MNVQLYHCMKPKKPTNHEIYRPLNYGNYTGGQYRVRTDDPYLVEVVL